MGNKFPFEKRQQWALALALFSLPLSLEACLVFLILAFFNSFSAPTSAWASKPIALLFVPFIAYFGLQIWSVFRGGDQGLALSKLETAEAFLLVPVTFLAGWKHLKHQGKWLLRWFLFGLAASMLFSLLEGVYQLVHTGQWYRNWSSGKYRDHHFFYNGLAAPLMHPAYYSTLLGVGLLALWTQKNLFSRTVTKWWGFLGVVFLLLLQGRMNLIAFGLVLGLWTLGEGLENKRWKPFLLLLTAGISLLVGMQFAPESIKSRITNEFTLSYNLQAPSIEDFTGFTIRLAEWECAAVPIGNHIGVGVGNGRAVAYLQEAYSTKGFVVGQKLNFNCHNQFLEIQLAHGLIGSAVLLAMVIALFWQARKKRNGLLALATGFQLLCMLTESMWQRHLGATSFVLLGALLLVLAEGPNEESSVEKGKE